MKRFLFLCICCYQVVVVMVVGQTLQWKNDIVLNDDSPIVRVIVTPTSTLLIGYANGIIQSWSPSASTIWYRCYANLLDMAIDPQCTIHCSLYLHTQTCHDQNCHHTIFSRSIASNTNVILYEQNASDDGTRGGMTLSTDGQFLFFAIGHQMLRIQIGINCLDTYCIPVDNPFENETYAIGLHNITFCYFDYFLNRAVCVDQGVTLGDAVVVIYPRSNYGWPNREIGSCLSDTSDCDYPLYYEMPIFTHSNIHQLKMAFVYRGIHLPNRYFNKVIAMNSDGLFLSSGSTTRNTIQSFRAILLHTSYQYLSMFQDATGDIFVLVNNGTNTSVQRFIAMQ